MEKYYTLKETSEILNVKVRTLRLWIEKGKLITKKYGCGKMHYVSEKEIERVQGEMK
jgi:predicted site-specific integrase-resolvase